MQVFRHEIGLLSFLKMRTQIHCGMAMELSPIFRYTPSATILYTILTNVLQPFTMRFPHTDIHELLTSDLLHQAIKGTFKDHLVVWVEDYLKRVCGPSKSASILDEIDQQYDQSQIL